MINRNNKTLARVDKETNEKVKQIARELSTIQQKNIAVPEVFRRAFNIPNMRDILREDAEIKRSKRQ